MVLSVTTQYCKDLLGGSFNCLEVVTIAAHNLMLSMGCMQVLVPSVLVTWLQINHLR